ncbi:MAG: hypothetical protein ACOYVD_13705 [Bacillota bacterium]
MHVLLISYFFPPLLAPEAMQAERAVNAINKYFPQLNHNLSILTVKPISSYGKKDKNIGIDNYYRYEAFSIEYLYTPLYLLNKESRYFPDTRKGWIGPAIRKGKDIINNLLKNKEKIIIWSRAQPYSSHLVALALKREFPDIPWVASFSDPWSSNPYAIMYSSINLQWEKKVLDNATILTCVTERMKNQFIKSYPSTEDRWRVLSHIYPEDQQECIEDATPGPLTITYTGNFYGIRTPEPLFKALAYATAIQNDLKGKIEIRLVGELPPKWKNNISKYNLEGLIIHTEPVPQGEALKYIKFSDMLLLIDADIQGSVFLPSKLVDYLAAKKPIISITPNEGVSWDILSKHGHFCFTHKDIELLGKFFINLVKEYPKYKNRKFSRPNEFEPEEVAKNLFEIFSDSLK